MQTLTNACVGSLSSFCLYNTNIPTCFTTCTHPALFVAQPHIPSTRNSLGECHPRVDCCQSQWVCHTDVSGPWLSSTLYHLDKVNRHIGGWHKIYQQDWRSAVVECVCVCVCARARMFTRGNNSLLYIPCSFLCRECWSLHDPDPADIS